MRDFNPDLYLSQLRLCRHLPESSMKHLCAVVRSLLMEESNVQPVSSPVTVCGDIHGQLWDLLELFKVGGEAPETSYVFMVRCPRSHNATFWLDSAVLTRIDCYRVILWTEATIPLKRCPCC